MSRLTPFSLLSALLFVGCDDARASAGAAHASTRSPEPAAGATADPARSTTLADAGDRYFRNGDVTIRYKVIGRGDPIVLLHGYTDRVEMWSGPADSLARDFMVIVPDVRGFGKSSKPAGTANYGQRTVDDIAALLEELKIPRAHVVGYSMGALMTANLALRYPARVRSATMIAGAFYENEAAMHADLHRYVEKLARGERMTDFFRFIVPTMTDSAAKAASDYYFEQNDSTALVHALDGIPTLAVDWKVVGETKVPGLAIAGLPDPLHRHTRLLASRWPGVTHVELAEGDHIEITNRPELLREVRRFANEH